MHQISRKGDIFLIDNFLIDLFNKKNVRLLEISGCVIVFTLKFNALAHKTLKFQMSDIWVVIKFMKRFNHLQNTPNHIVLLRKIRLKADP